MDTEKLKKDIKAAPVLKTIREGKVFSKEIGDPYCYVYFDCEFTGLHKNTSLISIGLTDFTGRTFYAEFTDYDSSQINPWIIDNVIKNLESPKTVLEGQHWTMRGTKNEIANNIYFWLDGIVSSGRTVQFVSDVCNYDFVLLVDLLTKGKTALDLPAWISATCYDINQDIGTAVDYPQTEAVDKALNSTSKIVRNYCPPRLGFDINRDEMVKTILGENYEIKGVKHNALFDAICMRIIHLYIWGMKILDVENGMITEVKRSETTEPN